MPRQALQLTRKHPRRATPRRAHGRSGWSLHNAVNDAKDVHDRLSKLGYASTLLADPKDLAALDAACRAFAARLRGGATARLFFAGHGMQNDEAETFLLPAGATQLPLDEVNIAHRACPATALRVRERHP